ncbi:MAG: C-terminal binding protein, partial [Trueperaceae bacterium]
DTIDLAGAKELGVWVANVPDYGVEEVASHAYAMALALIRHLAFYDRSVRSGEWHFLSPGELRRPSTLTFGIVGLGRIGRAVAAQARSLFGEVVGFDPFLTDDSWPDGVARLGLEEVVGRSQVVSLHLPLTADTHYLFNKKMIDLMPHGSYLINTSRGPLIDPVALHAALEEGRLSGAALDVLVQEPPHPENPLLNHPRTLLTPHAAFYSTEAATELRCKAARNILDWASKGRPTYVVVEGEG